MLGIPICGERFRINRKTFSHHFGFLLYMLFAPGFCINVYIYKASLKDSFHFKSFTLHLSLKHVASYCCDVLQHQRIFSNNTFTFRLIRYVPQYLLWCKKLMHILEKRSLHSNIVGNMSIKHHCVGCVPIITSPFFHLYIIII